MESKTWRLQWPLLSLISGALTTLAFAPFDFSWLVFFTLAVPFYLWQRLSAKQAAISAWLFGLGLQCSGVSWIYYSLHVHGSAPVVFAALLIFLLCCYLSIYTALAAYVVNRFLPNNTVLRLMLFYPASWVIFEWLQGYVMTGFAWMQLGYTQIDFPLSGFSPVFGNHAVGGFIAVCAGALALLFKQNRQLNYKLAATALLPVIILWGVGIILKPISWTDKYGEPIKVSIIQGNIAQENKWKPQMKQPTMKLYRELSLAQQDADLIVWPETAVPDYWYRVVPYVQQLRAEMKQRETDLLLGIFVKNDSGRFLNSVLSVNGDVYNKRHLVPLGEFIPLRFLIEFFNKFVKIPMSDIASGSDDQPLLTAAGIPLGLSICFEEAFARDVIRDLPEAKLLVNVSNDAWFEDSIEPAQHHAIARMRALEAGRYMVRSTNTGITSFIGPHGEVIKKLPQFEVGVLKSEVQPLSGATPFVRWGDWLIVGLSSLLLLGFVFVKSNKKSSLDG
ncbi:Apolipoprotein N-acyltransferase / Copper homeostasis protein CutE [hydrothermal vent metagenome]|uniref:Apolipoprotein N-acyltransferase / Copper homeostasis protein CutE n=1 Tax=hydrothermal vent metagenome TaxID=652676 RepID=A0A3B0WR88_9ZZZZ